MSDDSVDSLIRQLERVRLQEALVLQRLIAARQREHSEFNQPEREAFRIGGRVNINYPKPRIGRSISKNNTRAIISKVTASRVYYKTLNGTSTWRSKNNLTIVHPEVVWTDDE